MLQKVVDSIAEAQELRPDSAEAWSSLGSDLCDGLEMEGCVDRLNKAKRRTSCRRPSWASRGITTGIENPERSKHWPTRLPDLLNAEMADWGNWALFMVGEKEAARVDRKGNAAAPGHRHVVLGRG